MQTNPKEIVQTLLQNVKDATVVKELCAPDVTYVSLNYRNPDLRKIMPWCGTSHGPEAILKTFHYVADFWVVDSFTPEEIFCEAGNVAVFGRFTYTFDEGAEDGDLAVCHFLQGGTLQNHLHAIHGGYVLRRFEFPLRWNLEISKRSSRWRSRNLTTELADGRGQ